MGPVRISLLGALSVFLVAACGLIPAGSGNQLLHRRVRETSSQVLRSFFTAAAEARFETIQAMSSASQPAEWAEATRREDLATIDAALRRATWMYGYHLDGDTVIAKFSIPNRRYQDGCYNDDSETDTISLEMLYTRTRVWIITVGTNSC